MLKQKFTHCHSHSHIRSKPLLTWRGLQAWCFGKRASGLCKLFIRLRTRPRFRLAFLLRITRGHDRSSKRQAFFLTWLAHSTKKKSPQACSCLPIASKTEAHEGCRSPHGLTPDTPDGIHAQSQKAFKRIDELHAKSSCSPHTSSARLGLANHNSMMSCLPGRSSEDGEAYSDPLSAASSTHSLSSSSRSSSSAGSFHRVSGSWRLREACAKVVSGSPSICELVAGNQFLVHLSAAPIASTAPTRSSNGGLVSTEKHSSSELNPSMGVVTNAALKYKESELKDRLVFFK